MTVPRPYRAVAVPAAVAIGAIAAIAADRAGLAWPLGFAAGALAGCLAVLALPSLPTGRVTVLLLAAGGFGALRHAPASGEDRSLGLALWAGATLVALVLVDRAGAEAAPALPGGRPLRPWARETARVSVVIGAIVVAAGATLVPTLTEQLGRRVWPGVAPSFGDLLDAPASLRATEQLDMAARPRLSDRVVFTVDAPRAAFWRGETFDAWDGRTWARSDPSQFSLHRTSAGAVPVPAGVGDDGAESGEEMRQTFHVETRFAEVVFAAPSPRVVQTDRPLLGRPDGTVAVAGAREGFGRGSVYTVVSRSVRVTEDDLRRAGAAVPEPILAAYAQEPASTTERVRALAREITAPVHGTYDKIRALEEWLGAHTVYSLDAPLSPPGVDVVDDFLFRSRVGWCEQIASSLVVMARTVGIPARLATGFVPGSRDALSGRFVVRERDAHAWAEVYFPGIGWQGFDPTASVPLAGEARTGGSWLASVRRHALPAALAVAVLVLVVRAAPRLRARAARRRAARASWGARALTRLERTGRRVGRARAPAETPQEYARALAARLGRPALEAVGAAIDADGFSATGASPSARAEADAVLASLRP